MQKFILQTSHENLEASENFGVIPFCFKMGEQRIVLTFFPTAVFGEGNFPEI